MGRFLMTLIIAGILITGGMYYTGYFDGSESGVESAYTPTAKAPDPKTLGQPLFPMLDFPPSTKAKIQGIDPLIFRGIISPKERIDLAAQMAGEVLFVGQEIPAGAVEVAGLASFMATPYDFVEMRLPQKNIVRIYRRFQEGTIVNRDEQIGFVNPIKAHGVLFEKLAKYDVAIGEADAAKATADESAERVRTADILFRQKTISVEEWRTAHMTKLKYTSEYDTAKLRIKIAQVEVEQAKVQIQLHEIQNRISGDKAVIRRIYKPRGSSARDQEPIFELASVDSLLAEAQVDGQYEHRLLREPTVTIEPTVDIGPFRVLAGHTGAITAVAFTRDLKNPRVVVAAADDKYVSVWDRYSPLPVGRLRHPDPVRSLAVAHSGMPHNFLVTGTEKGNLFVWDLDSLGNDVPEPKSAPKEGLDEQPITALALSPDGKYVAVGSSDGSISIWHLTDKLTKLYAFDVEHGVDNPHLASVTSLHFTPQGRLISAGRDNTIRVWSVKEKGSHLLGDPITGRTGNVTQLGVSRDGRFMLADGERSLNLMTVKEMVMVNRLQNPNASISFESVAEFSDDANLLVTAGAPEGRLQLWRAPTETGRGFEVRQFVPEAKSPVTSVAFAPGAGRKDGASIAVSGAKNGEVYLWDVPTMEEVQSQRLENVKLKLLRRDLDPNTGKFRVEVELTNSSADATNLGRLISGRPVTIVVNE